MALSLSLSQSLSSSLVLHHQRHGRRLSQRHQCSNEQSQEDSNDERGDDLFNQDSFETRKELSLFKQFLCTVISFGYNCSIELEAIFSVVSLQYFGLPVYLVSLPGIISGALNSVVVPLLGGFSDRGPNPLKRKLSLQAFTTVCLLTGYIILGVCSWIKLEEMSGRVGQLNSTKTDGADYNVHTNTNTNGQGIRPSQNNTLSKINIVDTTEKKSEPDSEIPTIALVAVLPFVFFDTGYDTSIVMSRASVLEVSPSRQRNSILTMAALMSGLAGILAAIIGIVDFPGILGSTFADVDGFALALLLFSVFYGLLGLVTAVCSIRTTWKAYRENLLSQFHESKNEVGHLNSKEDGIPPIKSSRVKNNQNSIHKSINVSGSKSDLNTEALKAASLLSMSIESTQRSRLLHDMEKRHTTAKGYGAFISSLENSSLIQSGNSTFDILDSGRSHSSISESLKDTPEGEKNRSIKFKHHFDNKPNDMHSSARKSSRTSLLLSISKSYEKFIGDGYLQKLREREKDMSRGKSQSQSPSSLWNIRFCVCILAIFFCGSSITSITYYQSNTLTFEVYGGNPSALPGSPGRILYEKAIRMSSFGTLSAFTSVFLFILASPKLINRLGALTVFIISNTLETIATFLFCVYPSLATYFTMMVVYGVNKSVYLAVAFIVAMLYAPLNVVDESGNRGSHNSSSSDNSSPKVVGQVISLVAVTVPIGYVIVSAIMGPCMDATGSAWPPMFFAVCMALSAVITGIILYLLK